MTGGSGATLANEPTGSWRPSFRLRLVGRQATREAARRLAAEMDQRARRSVAWMGALARVPGARDATTASDGGWRGGRKIAMSNSQINRGRRSWRRARFGVTPAQQRGRIEAMRANTRGDATQRGETKVGAAPADAASRTRARRGSARDAVNGAVVRYRLCRLRDLRAMKVRFIHLI
ncbi:hypothetical protein Scep_029638 [Stephania cephalantha]|uniref:Uncharacterized protein n=1 Tax=Stephania cephalantha TaxID=152367 RepID=A0AAP0E1N1_9MAGN